MVGKRIIKKITDELVGKPDYTGIIKAHFDYLIVLMVKFLCNRIDGESTKFHYLRSFSKRSEAPKESDLQSDLHNFLLSNIEAEVEKTDISSGRVDIYIKREGFRIVIELKRSFTQWSDDLLEPFLIQTTAYQQTDIRLGLLGVLDLSDRQPGAPHFDQCFAVKSFKAGEMDQRTALVMRVPGNVRTPSNPM